MSDPIKRQVDNMLHTVELRDAYELILQAAEMTKADVKGRPSEANLERALMLVRDDLEKRGFIIRRL